MKATRCLLVQQAEQLNQPVKTQFHQSGDAMCDSTDNSEQDLKTVSTSFVHSFISLSFHLLQFVIVFIQFYTQSSFFDELDQMLTSQRETHTEYFYFISEISSCRCPSSPVLQLLLQSSCKPPGPVTCLPAAPRQTLFRQWSSLCSLDPVLLASSDPLPLTS